MSRADLYLTIHKGIRALLFAACTRVGCTDFADVAEAQATAGSLRRLLGLLAEHAAHEDAVIQPVLAGLAPELHADLQSQHAKLHGLEAELARLLARLADATPAERESLGLRVHGRMGRLAAEYLLHLEREETEANRVLWAHRTDAELQAMRGRILGSIPGPRLAEWLEIVLPVASPRERASMLAGLEGATP